jgi:hypothetical protein
MSQELEIIFREEFFTYHVMLNRANAVTEHLLNTPLPLRKVIECILSMPSKKKHHPGPSTKREFNSVVAHINIYHTYRYIADQRQISPPRFVDKKKVENTSGTTKR